MPQNFQHNQAAHCENGATVDLLKFSGVDINEPLVFGIGYGLFFSYLPFFKLNSLPVVTFRPYPGMIFRGATRLLGVKVKRDKFKKPEKSMQQLDKLLSKGIPVGMRVGVFYLPYFPPEYRFHFNSHNLVVFDKKDGQYMISDPVMENIETLNYEELKRVRFAQGSYPPKGRMYYIRKIPDQIDLKKAIICGIRKNCRLMLNIPLPYFGVRGIRYLSSKMRKWPERLGDKKAALYLGQVIRMLEEIGTGGAGFRFMYAAFLQQAAVILQNESLNKISSEMTEAGDKWREFAWYAGKIFKNRYSPEISYSFLADLLLKLADREEGIYKELKKIKFRG